MATTRDNKPSGRPKPNDKQVHGPGALVPDRRRQHFASNGGPRLSAATKATGRTGIAAARKVLEQHRAAHMPTTRGG